MSSYNTNMKVMMMQEPHFKNPKLEPPPPPPLNHHHHHQQPNFRKTLLCRRFQHGGVCDLGSRCNYAHGIAELRAKPQFCRMYFRTGRCSYGDTCRFHHSSTARSADSLNWVYEVSRHPQIQPPEQGKLDRYSSAEYKVIQTSDAATNASTSTVATSSLNKNEPHAVKFVFKNNELRKISGIYADWIEDLSLHHS